MFSRYRGSYVKLDRGLGVIVLSLCYLCLMWVGGVDVGHRQLWLGI